VVTFDNAGHAKSEPDLFLEAVRRSDRHALHADRDSRRRYFINGVVTHSAKGDGVLILARIVEELVSAQPRPAMMIRKLVTFAGIFAIIVLGATSADAKGGGHSGGHGGHFAGHSPGAGYPYDRTAQPSSQYRCQPGVCFND
jgi:hypothetical protein